MLTTTLRETTQLRQVIRNIQAPVARQVDWGCEPGHHDWQWEIQESSNPTKTFNFILSSSRFNRPLQDVCLELHYKLLELEEIIEEEGVETTYGDTSLEVRLAYQFTLNFHQQSTRPASITVETWWELDQ